VSKTTPADLAVTFRSLARRRREAIGETDPGRVVDLVAELDRHVAEAASAVGAAPNAEAVAAAISARHADDWDESTLDTVRASALDAGAVLRRIAARVEADRD
jgi:hypothetical protein